MKPKGLSIARLYIDSDILFLDRKVKLSLFSEQVDMDSKNLLRENAYVSSH
jgi:hypothetical protein